MTQWITRLPTEQKIPGSSPGKIEILFYFISHQFIAFNKTYTDPFHAKMDIIIYFHKIINVNMFYLCKGVQTHIKLAYGVSTWLFRYPAFIWLLSIYLSECSTE